MYKLFQYSIAVLQIFLFTPKQLNAQKLSKNDAEILTLFVAGQNGYVTKNENFFLLVGTNPGKSLPAAWIKSLGNGWYIIENSPGALKKLAVPGESFQYYPANNLWKLTGELLKKYTSHELKFPISCHLWLKPQPQRYSPVIAGKDIDSGYPIRKVELMSMAELRKLLENESVISIEEIRVRKAMAESSVQRYDPAANTINLAQRAFPEITGSGLTVSIKENRFDTADIDLKKRWFLTGYSSPTANLHATEISSMVGGSGNTGPLGRGVATRVKFTSASFDDLMPEPPAYFKNNSISVQNHSYGTGIENQYATDAAAYDLLAWRDSGLLHVFSAGNEGTGTPQTGTYKGLTGFNNLTGSFKMSKNTISVGATDSFYRVEALASKGPAYDGRIKPELVAFGIDGTSGAAALTSGTALLLQQALKETTGNFPASSLVKAILVGSAGEIGPEGPDYASGFGRLDAYKAVSLARKKQFFTGMATPGNESVFTLQVPPNTRNLKITLCWTDTAATPSSAFALVNDLDLTVENQSTAAVWNPWILSVFPHPDSLAKPAFTGKDHLNNIEQISIKNPQEGNYRVKVSPYTLFSKQQPFSIAYQFESADSLYCTYPAATDAIPAGTAIPTRWQHTFSPGTALKIELNTGNAGWQTIVNAINADAGYLYWKVPDTTVMARLRFTASGQTFLSDSFFITANPAPFPGYVCNDASLLVWKPLKQVSGYNIYALGDTLMEKIGTTADTVFRIQAGALKNNWVGISAMPVGNNRPETRFPTFNIFNQGIGCYFKNFIAEWNNGEALLRIALGTTYGIQSLDIQKYNGAGFGTLQTISPVSATGYSYTDKPLANGAHTYKVVLKLTDGSTVESEWQTIIQPNASGWWVYPNPVKRGSPLKILNRISDTDDIFVDIYDLTGRKTGTRIIPLIDNTLPVTNLAAGMYLLVFTDGKKQLGTQKLLVLP